MLLILQLLLLIIENLSYFWLRCGLRTGGRSGGSARGISRWTCVKTVICLSSEASCSPMRTCTLLTVTTTGPTRGSRPKTFRSLTQWARWRHSPCSRPRVPFPPWAWAWAWPRAWTSATWTASAAPLSILQWAPPLAHTEPRPLPRTGSTGTRAAPVSRPSDSNPSSIPVSDTEDPRASTTVNGLTETLKKKEISCATKTGSAVTDDFLFVLFGWIFATRLFTWTCTMTWSNPRAWISKWRCYIATL